MTSRQSNPPSQRPRGRPKGTTKFEREDLRLLGEFADLVIGDPHAKLAPLLIERGYEQKDIRRAQKRWREEKSALKAEAQLRADARPGESLFDLMFYFGEAVSHLAERARPAIGKVADSLERAQRRVAARKELGLDLGLPLDLTEPEAVEQAIRRYEKTVAAGHGPTEFKQLTFSELPLSLKLYATALMLHALSLQVAEADQQKGEE